MGHDDDKVLARHLLSNYYRSAIARGRSDDEAQGEVECTKQALERCYEKYSISSCEQESTLSATASVVLKHHYESAEGELSAPCEATSAEPAESVGSKVAPQVCDRDEDQIRAAASDVLMAVYESAEHTPAESVASVVLQHQYKLAEEESPDASVASAVLKHHYEQAHVESPVHTKPVHEESPVHTEQAHAESPVHNEQAQEESPVHNEPEHEESPVHDEPVHEESPVESVASVVLQHQYKLAQEESVRDEQTQEESAESVASAVLKHHYEVAHTESPAEGVASAVLQHHYEQAQEESPSQKAASALVLNLYEVAQEREEVPNQDAAVLLPEVNQNEAAMAPEVPTENEVAQASEIPNSSEETPVPKLGQDEVAQAQAHAVLNRNEAEPGDLDEGLAALEAPGARELAQENKEEREGSGTQSDSGSDLENGVSGFARDLFSTATDKLARGSIPPRFYSSLDSPGSFLCQRLSDNGSDLESSVSGFTRNLFSRVTENLARGSHPPRFYSSLDSPGSFLYQRQDGSYVLPPESRGPVSRPQTLRDYHPSLAPVGVSAPRVRPPRSGSAANSGSTGKEVFFPRPPQAGADGHSPKQRFVNGRRNTYGSQSYCSPPKWKGSTERFRRQSVPNPVRSSTSGAVSSTAPATVTSVSKAPRKLSSHSVNTRGDESDMALIPEDEILEADALPDTWESETGNIGASLRSDDPRWTMESYATTSGRLLSKGVSFETKDPWGSWQLDAVRCVDGPQGVYIRDSDRHDTRELDLARNVDTYKQPLRDALPSPVIESQHSIESESDHDQVENTTGHVTPSLSMPVSYISAAGPKRDTETQYVGAMGSIRITTPTGRKLEEFQSELYSEETGIDKPAQESEVPSSSVDVKRPTVTWGRNDVFSPVEYSDTSREASPVPVEISPKKRSFLRKFATRAKLEGNDIAQRPVPAYSPDNDKEAAESSVAQRPVPAYVRDNDKEAAESSVVQRPVPAYVRDNVEEKEAAESSETNSSEAAEECATLPTTPMQEQEALELRERILSSREGVYTEEGLMVTQDETADALVLQEWYRRAVNRGPMRAPKKKKKDSTFLPVCINKVDDHTHSSHCRFCQLVPRVLRRKTRPIATNLPRIAPPPEFPPCLRLLPPKAPKSPKIVQ